MNIFLVLAAAVFFPSAPDLWKQGPLTDKALAVPAAEVVASQKQLETQQRLFRQLRSPGQRSRMALEFANAGNPEAFRILVKLLRSEKDPFVQDDLLNAMLVLKQKGFAVPGGDDWLPKYFQAVSPMARCAAMILYLTNAKEPSPAVVINALHGETSAMVLNRLTESLRLFLSAARMVDSAAGRVQEAEVVKLYDKTPQENILLRAFAAELAAQLSAPDGSPVVEKALKDPSAVIRMRTARGLAANPEAVKTFAIAAQDGHPAVRLAAARIMVSKNGLPDPERVQILISLLSDESPAVRAAAAESLGSINAAEAADALVKAFADPEIAVRRAVADALIRLGPGEPIRRKAVEVADRHVYARRQVLAFLAGIRDRTRTDVIVRWTEGSDDPLFLVEAVRAAGELKLTGFICLGQKGIEDRLPRDAEKKNLPGKEYRLAAAFTYGELLNEAIRTADRAEYWKKTSIPALTALSSDPDADVAAAAMMSIWRNPECRPQFAPVLTRMLRNRKSGWSDCRAIAIRALSGWKLNARNIADLTDLITKACIRAPQMPPEMDTDAVRISALMLLREQSGQGNRAAETALKKITEKLEKANADSDLRNEAFDEFRRQMNAAAAGKPVEPKRIEDAEPVFSAGPARADP